jgi:hypothetical protein
VFVRKKGAKIRAVGNRPERVTKAPRYKGGVRRSVAAPRFLHPSFGTTLPQRSMFSCLDGTRTCFFACKVFQASAHVRRLEWIPKLSGGWKPSENADARSLQLDLKVRLNTLGGLNNILQHGIKLIIIDIQNHLLGHKADGSAVHAGQLFNGIFNFGGAVCTINFDFEFLLHDNISFGFMINIF